MNVLIVGAGGREHAITAAVAQSPRVRKLYAAPGNPGIAAAAECVSVGFGGVEEIADWALAHAIDLTIVGPEAPLTVGIADAFARRGLKLFGPSRAAARLEASKRFAKELMARFDIPTARYAAFDELDDAVDYVRREGAPIVVKADGLAAGKGVVVAQTVDEAEEALRSFMQERSFGEAGAQVVVEEYLEGVEASVFAVCDGVHAVPLAAAQDHKRALDGDVGPNTGGMGAFAPTPTVDEPMMARIQTEIVQPTVAAMAEVGAPYTGVLYVGLMLTELGPKVIEFNCRLGDPEAQAVLPRLRTDLVDVCEAATSRTLQSVRLDWDPRPAVTVVLASEGYPGAHATGCLISGVEAADAREGVSVFHAGTARTPSGGLVTAGGRVLTVTALGATIGAAADRAYSAVEHISFAGMRYRRDIGRVVNELSEANN